MVSAALSLELAPGRYRLLDLAGLGGAGEVWRAIRTRDGALVALKLARTESLPHAGSEPLAREATHAGLALAPRLPELLDVGFARVEGASVRPVDEPGGSATRAFLAQRWIDGAALAPRALAREPSEVRVALALAVARDAGEALADLHGIGVAHGDIKPENLIVTASSAVHVIDLGLAGPVYAPAVRGGTLRYLARGDADLGDARARDLLALGVVLAEIARPDVAAAADPITAARAAVIEASARCAESAAALRVDAITTALLAPNPGARPSALWAAETARAALRAAGTRDADERGERDARQVRATYLRLRLGELDAAASAHDDAAPWLAEAIRCAGRAREIASPLGSRHEAGPLGACLPPLSPEQRARWLTALVGSSATAWPLGALAATSERALAEALTELARRLPPPSWTFHDVESAALGKRPGGARHGAPARGAAIRAGNTVDADDAIDTIDTVDAANAIDAIATIDGETAAELAIAITCVPPDPLALARVEQNAAAPPALALAAAETLRRLGDHGRARALALREVARAEREADRGRGALALPALHALAAEILRRAGDTALAERNAVRALEAKDPPAEASARARATLARIALDRGALDEAARLAQPEDAAAVCEVAALVAAARGDGDGALDKVRRGEALARTAEERARLAAVRGYVRHGVEPAETYAAFRAAVDYAVSAGAVVEEATYRAGAAAAAVSVGELGAAIVNARRAALLWEHLGKPALAARAMLAAAAAYATAGAAHDAVRAAEEAAWRARDGGERRTEAYALWAIADVSAPASASGRAASEHARALLEGGSAEDELRAAARVLRHRAPLDRPLQDLDHLAAPERGLPADARLDWWGTRAARLLDEDAPVAAEGARALEAREVITAITALAEARAPIATRGPALAGGYALAARAGLGETAQRLFVALGEAARDLVGRAPPELAAATRALPWVLAAASAREGVVKPEQARELERLVLSLGDREHLGPLLCRVVDALVLWTGVERGLLLLRAPEGRLVPRAARNLARRDLGPEQLALSQTLARRAIEAREPVIAVDAAGELPSVHQSVHNLKLRSVLAVPLIARGEPLGVVYLDDRARRGAFGPNEIAFARAIASLAALAIADARDQALLRRAARKARRASAELAEALAQREAALDVAERELQKARGARDTRYTYDAIVGESPPVRAMLKLVDRVTGSDVPVLVTGESGSGKELVARAIHHNGSRGGRPFVGENCGAIPEGLLESTLFGHVRGAFSGASASRTGLFEVAHRGTLFLDEIGEMSLAMQAKILRVLEDGLVRPVGSERARKVNVRIIAATHRDLEAMVQARSFREDLFYRLNVITVRVPPLRERPEDVPLLVRRFLAEHGGGRAAAVTPRALERLAAHAWPGNVRQLENEIRRALVLSDGTIDLQHLSAEIAGRADRPGSATGLDLRSRIDALAYDLVREALERTEGNQTRAAKLLGLSRFGLQKMIKRLTIEAR
jgi:serine/threonine-protein kinase PknK